MKREIFIVAWGGLERTRHSQTFVAFVPLVFSHQENPVPSQQRCLHHPTPRLWSVARRGVYLEPPWSPGKSCVQVPDSKRGRGVRWGALALGLTGREELTSSKCGALTSRDGRTKIEVSPAPRMLSVTQKGRL